METLHRLGQRFGLAASLSVALLLGACEQQQSNKLIEDVSTEADVKRVFGEPKTVTIAADGTRTLDYPRQPEGTTNYVMVIGPDGKLKSLRQLLNADNFSKVQPGMTREEVAKLLGPHARERRFDLKNELVREWRYQEQMDNKIFSATFDPAGRVVSTASAPEPRQEGN
jgi:hypothetical protein